MLFTMSNELSKGSFLFSLVFILFMGGRFENTAAGEDILDGLFSMNCHLENKQLITLKTQSQGNIL